MRLRQRILYLASGTLLAWVLLNGDITTLTTAAEAESLRQMAIGKYSVSTTALKGNYTSEVKIYVTIIDTETGEIVLQREFDKKKYGSAQRW